MIGDAAQLSLAVAERRTEESYLCSSSMRLHGSGFGDWGWCGGCLPCGSRNSFPLRLWVCFNLQSQHHSGSDWRFSNLLNHPEMAAFNFFPSRYEPFLQLACNPNTVGSWLSLVQSHLIVNSFVKKHKSVSDCMFGIKRYFPKKMRHWHCTKLNICTDLQHDE